MVTLPGDAGTDTIRVVWGAGTGPTGVASYDAALADAGVHDYNLITVSSVVPTGWAVEAHGTAPALGDVGETLTVVQARATLPAPGRATAGLAWATGDGPGLFYEATGAFDEATARDELERGLAAGRRLREWDAPETSFQVTTATAEEGYVSAVVLGVYGSARPIHG